MTRCLHAELLKLRRSMMVPIGFAGAAVTPLVSFAGYMLYRSKYPGKIMTLEELCVETSLYLALLISTPLFGVIGAWLVNREFAEHTMKDLLVIPVRRTKLLLSKYAVLGCWILILCLWSIALALALGFLGRFPGFSAELVLRHGLRSAAGAGLFFLMTPPIVAAALVFRNYVPVLVLTVCLTLVSVVVGNSEYQSVWPWSAVWTILSNAFEGTRAPLAAYASVGCASAAGFVLSVVAINRMEIV